MCCDLQLRLAAAHRADFQRAAEARRLVAASRLPVHRPVRRRAGWWLVALGLRLAVGRGHQVHLPA